MNIQEFNNLKVGDMVKVWCYVCNNFHIGTVTEKQYEYKCIHSKASLYPYCNKRDGLVFIDNDLLKGEKFSMGSIIRKLPKPEKRTAYWCKTRDAAKKFLEDCEAWGIKWCMGEDATKFSNWILGKNGVNFYLHERGAFVNGDNCISWSGRTHDKLDEYDIDRYIEYPSGKVLWDRAEEEAKKKAAEAVNNLGKPATLRDEINKRYQEAWIKFHKTYANTDSIKCCCKNKCCSCANYKPTVKEVKRSAKVGEYIKIVAEYHTILSCGKYTNGDIGLVTMLNGSAIKATINGYNDVPVGAWEYVVLENYIPEVKEVKRPAKAGEYIKIVDEWHTADTKGKYTNGDIGLVTRGCNGCYIRISINGHHDVLVSDVPREYVVLENYIPE